jgi:hypothetical protein
MLEKILMRLGSVKVQSGHKNSKIPGFTTYHVATVRVDHDVVIKLDILQLDLNGVEPTTSPIVDLDQVPSKDGRRQAA